MDDAFCDTYTLDRLGHRFEMLEDVKVFEPRPQDHEAVFDLLKSRLVHWFMNEYLKKMKCFQNVSLYYVDSYKF